MASNTKATTVKRKNKHEKAGRRRKNKLARKSTAVGDRAVRGSRRARQAGSAPLVVLHAPSRLATRRVCSVDGGLAAVALVAWSIYVRQTTCGRVGRSRGLRSGLALAAR